MNTPIAIVGIGCRFPGGSDSPEQLWRLLTDGVDAITEVPPDRWDLRSYYHPDPTRAGRTYARWGGFVGGVDEFDGAFFSMSAREAARADPQQRLVLEVAYEALEDAGLTLDGVGGRRGGVFIGISSYDYGGMQCSRNERHTIDAYTNLGSALSIAANRISYFFNLHGPSLAVDTACSSSLVAVDLACRSIWQGECELAFAGGVSLMLRPEPTIGFSKASMLAPDGRCKSFAAAANGYARGEGAGIVLLKPLPQAVDDGDAIYAVIRSTAVNQDGRTGGISVPSADAQAAMLREALARAGVDAHSVQYVEAHGTGTPVGDPIEARALGAVFGASRPSGRECLIGSIKSNFGHPEAAAGAAGLIKAALAVQRAAIPASLHVTTPSPQIPFDELKIRVVDTLTPWPETDGGPRRAGVNSFGFGGTNAHVILESAPPRASSAALPSGDDRRAGPALIPISARTPEALRAVADSYARFIDERAAGISLADIGHTAALRRSHHDHRLAIVAYDTGDLHDRLRAFLDGETGPLCSAGRQSPSIGPVFVCSGMGQQWWAMGRQLIAEEPVYREVVDRVDEILGPLSGWSLRRELGADECHSRIHDTQIAQPAIFATQVALATLLKSWGIQPLAIVGHSVGEVAAAHLAGVLTLDDAVKVAFHRSRLQQRTAGLGTMLAAAVSWEGANRLIARYEGAVSVAAINSARSVTLSGDAGVLRTIAQELEATGVFCRALNVDVPYHSSTMDALATELVQSLAGVRPRAASTPLYSTVAGGAVDGSSLDATYWWQNLRQPVLFHQAMTQAIGAGHHTFIELGAHPVLSVSIGECLAEQHQKGVVLPSLRRGEPERATVLGSVGRLYTLGAAIDWRALTGGGGTFVKLPNYPWQRERHWHESDLSRRERLGDVVHPLLGMRMESAEPRFLLELDLATLPFLADHRVQGAAIFPAAGYVEMGLAVAQQLFGPAPCTVEDLELRKALFLSEKHSLTEIAVQSSTQTFEVSTQTTGAGSWTGHARGLVRALPNAATRKPLDLEAVRRRCPTEVSGEACYRRFQLFGLEYGPAFQPIARLWSGQGEAYAELRLPDVGGRPDEFRLHPSLLDGLLQVMIGAFAAETESALHLPIRIDRLSYYAAPAGRLFGHARIVERSGADIKADLVLAGEDGTRFVDVRGLTCRAIEAGTQTADRAVYQYQWRLQPRTEPVRPVRSAAHLPRPADLEPVLAREAGVLRERWARETFHGDCNRLCRDLAAAYIVEAFRQIGWDPDRDAAVSPADLAERLGVVAEHRRLFAALLAGVTPADLSSTRSSTELWQEIWERYPGMMAELVMTRPCGRQLAGVLRGEVNALSLIFPEGSSTTAEHLYQDSPTYRPYNQLIQKAVDEIVQKLPEGRTLRVLEIGGGTGGLSAFVLPVLPALRTQYTFTDITGMLVSKAEESFGHYPFIDYRTLDIDTDPIEQGFDPHGYDVIVASDVLHATRDLRRTVGHVARLLASEGTLLLLEGVHPQLFDTLVFGMLKGWWLFTDSDLRPADPWITESAWRGLLAEAGFGQSFGVTDAPMDARAVHSVIVARGPIVPPAAASNRDARRHWLVFADRRHDAEPSAGDLMAASLRARGQDVVAVYPGSAFARRDDGGFVVNPGSASDFELLFEALPWPLVELPGIVHLWSLEAPSADDADGREMEQAWRVGLMSALHLAQVLAARAGSLPALWLVTRGAQIVGGSDSSAGSVAQSVVWGLGSTVVNECPQLRCHMIDLGDGGAEEIQGLVAELFNEDDEDQIAVRGDARYIRRLQHLPKPEDAAPAVGTAPAAPPAFRIEASVPGVLATLEPHEISPRPPGPGEVQIEVVAAALNFKDVMMAMALLPPEATRGGYSLGMLGLECAGRVTAVGAGVEGLREGDAVLASGSGCLASHVTVDARFVVRTPSHMSFEEAATIPVAFLTAHYGLHTLARMQPGERVLIHAGSGGVGLAAIQLAQRAGADVLATAGSPWKRELLKGLGVAHVMDSRSVAFADEILEVTGGDGVDIVLNSLSGEAIAKSLSILRPGGRFVELGKRDIYENRLVGLRPFGDNISFFSVDLDRIGARQPQVIRSMFTELMAAFESRALHPLQYRLFPLARVATAFRHLAQARHAGKVLISLEDTGRARVAPAARPFRARADGSYLITGGLGGFGLSVARFLAERGARHLVLAGRRGHATPDIAAAVAWLEGEGVRVTVVALDVTNEREVGELLASIRASGPPLCGIVHAAMVLDDALLQNMSEEKMWRALLPKALGAWHLHRLTIDDPLDLFVMFSSITSLIGSPGQSNYVAGNAFLDALAEHRRRRGLPALTVNWGAVAGTGYVARNRDIEERLQQVGMTGRPVQQMLAALGRLLESDAVVAGVAQLDWQRTKQLLGTRISPRFSTLVAANAEEPSGPRASLQVVLDTEPAARPALLEGYVRDQVARVLGTSAAKLDAEQPLLSLGLDSLMAVEMRNRVQMELGVDIPPLKFMEGISIAGVAAHVAEQLAVQHPARPLAGTPPAAAAAPPADVTASVDDLSDEDVDRRLRAILESGTVDAGRV